MTAAPLVADECQPLLQPTNERRDSTTGKSQTHEEHFTQVAFDPKGDPDNPLEWPVLFKRGIVALLALMAFTV